MSWESISLSDALRPLKSSPFTRDELNYSSGQYQNVHYGDILVRFPSVVDAKEEGLPYVSDSAEGRCSRCSLLQNGDIIIADTAEDEAVGKAIEIQGITDQKVVSGLHTMAFRPQEGLFAPGFLGYFLNSSVYHNQLLPLMQGIKVLSISKTAIGDTVIKYPSYKEQEKIVESLSGVDDIIGALDEAIAKKQQIKEGLMQQLLTGKTRLPGFSGERRSIKLCSIASITIGEFVHQKKMNPDGLYPVYNGGRTFTGFYDDFNNSANKIVMSARGLAGFVNKVERPYWAGNSSYSIDVKDPNVDWVFVYYFMKYHESEFTDNQQKGGGIPAVNKNQVEEFVVQLPIELAEQHAISRALDSIDQEIELLLSKQKKCYSLKQGMMQELLTGKTRIV